MCIRCTIREICVLVKKERKAREHTKIEREREFIVLRREKKNARV